MKRELRKLARAQSRSNSDSQPKIERRMVKSEVRSTKSDDGKPKIGGYAAVFSQMSEDLGWFKEEIIPGAFQKSIDGGADIRCLFNHDPNFILGRTKSKTLTVKEDEKGLAYECEPPDSPNANSVVASIERGDVDGSSFGFYVRKQEWVEEEDANGDVNVTRRILEAEIFDVSPCVFPAYQGTSVGVRSLWPEGMPTEVRSKLMELPKRSKRNEDCMCDCAECEDGDCAECSDADCSDPNCEGTACEHSRSKQPADTPPPVVPVVVPE